MSERIEQLVILGVGLDTRADRLPQIDKMRVFEVELPEPQKDKKAKLAKYLGSLPPNVMFVPIDFNTQTLESVFVGTPIRFIEARGLHLGRSDAVHYRGCHAPDARVRWKIGSRRRIAFTEVLKSVIDGNSDVPGARRLMTEVAKQGAPWIFGLDPTCIGEYLEPFQLVLKADVTSTDYQGRYLRPINHKPAVSECQRIAAAVVR